MLKVVSTNLFSGLKTHNIALGAVETSEGVDVILKIDGEDIFFDETTEDPQDPIIPEPGSLTLLGAGIVGSLGYRVRRKRA